MTNPVDYQAPLPQGRNLRFHDLPDGIRISRDRVAPSAVWREVVAAVVPSVFFPAAFVYVLWSLIRYWNSASSVWIFVRVLIAIAIPPLSVRLFRDLWQNAGIVTDITVTKSTLFWRKQMPWGAREYFWSLTTVRFARVDKANRILKVYRQRGTPLGAFSFHRLEELEAAAAALNHAIGHIRVEELAASSRV